MKRFMKSNGRYLFAFCVVCCLMFIALMFPEIEEKLPHLISVDLKDENQSDQINVMVDAVQTDKVQQADKKFEKKNYADAAKDYFALTKLASPKEKFFHYVHQRLIASRLRLQLFDDAVTAAEAYVNASIEGTLLDEAATRHMVGNLYMSLPHWGTRSGGKFYRGVHKQGLQLQSWKHDKKLALTHLEKARARYEQYDRSLKDEKEKFKVRTKRIQCLFDLASACSRFGIYENNWVYWWGWWGERDDEASETAGEDDFTEAHSQWHMRRKRPIGLRIDQEGNPIFPFKPRVYASDLSDDQKILYLLDEIRQIDPTLDKHYTAQSYYRQAMLARVRFGMDRLNNYANYYYAGQGQPLKKELEKVNPWELKENQALVLAGGELRTVTLPVQYDVIGLLKTVYGDYESTLHAAEAQYAHGLYLQTRQQYIEAIEVYEAVKGTAKRIQANIKTNEELKARLEKELTVQNPQRPDHPVVRPYRFYLGLDRLRREGDAWRAWGNWQGSADQKIREIKAPQLQLTQTSVQLPGLTHQQLNYRNVDKVYFVAREIDHIGYINLLRDLQVTKKYRNLRWQMNRWHQPFINNHRNNHPELTAKYIGKEVARWSSDLQQNGTFRYSQQRLQTPLVRRGAYIIYAYLEEPSKNEADIKGAQLLGLGHSRSIQVMTDVAIVEKQVKEGKLLLVTDALSGEPLRSAAVSIYEHWTEYNRKKKESIHKSFTHHRKTNDEGVLVLALQERKSKGSQIHVLVTSKQRSQVSRNKAIQEREQIERHAWSGMRYWGHYNYNPSRHRDGETAYVVTDRPVYRPNQTVKFKVWVRQSQMGKYKNIPGKQVSITIFDRKGNKIKTLIKHTDQFGGIDGEMVLGDEPSLGMYRLQVRSGRYIGGGQFRVEEYKKPEFEVAVSTQKDHLKLGDKINATIKANYYFGGEVKNAKVSYKVFREQYKHSYYAPGAWDWLYGPGYGRSWYAYDFYPWWGRVKHCWNPPGWWYGYWRPGHVQNPVRELVKQGEGRIGEDGTLKVEIDTAKAMKEHGDQDHRYIIKAEVRDQSRRTIMGEGDIKVTRQSYYTFMQAQGGFYKPGDEIYMKVRCLTPGNKPIKTNGVVTVSSVVFGDSGSNPNSQMEEKVLERFEAGTNEMGELTLNFRYEKSGLLKFAFESPDKWGDTVFGASTVWVVGQDFKGKLYRFNDLELITDKRTYQPGETAHVMINTKRKDSYVLFADEVDQNHLLSYKMLHLTGGSKVIHIPIKDTHQPNFFLEATTVADTRVHSQMKRIVVPPENGVVNLDIKTDKSKYQPGEEASVTVTATNLQGEPVETQLAMSAFDQSVTYIQNRLEPKIEKFFHGRVRNHHVHYQTNLTEQFSSYGPMHRPYQSLYPRPREWWGLWTPGLGDARTANLNAFKGMGAAGQDDNWLAATDGDFSRDLNYSIAAKTKKSRRTSFGGGAVAESAMMSDAAAAPRSRMQLGAKEEKQSADPSESGGEPEYAEAQLRSKFADTAFWGSSLVTNSDGQATTTFKMPENLTTWQINTWGMTKSTKVGQAQSSVITTKDLLIRLQAPRFFMEYDEVVVSANINNYLSMAKQARVSIEATGDHLVLLKDTPKVQHVNVPAGSEARVDWRFKVKREGSVSLTVKALTDEASDAMKMSFPVLVHGMNKQVATSSSMQPQEGEKIELDGKNLYRKSQIIELTIPDKCRPEMSKLEVKYAPSLVGSMLDALPYCLDYPYGCTEQTVSRFLPAVLTLKTMQNMGITLEELKTMRKGRMEEIRRIEKGEGYRIYSHIDNPVFDTDYMEHVIHKGLKRIGNMQNSDGGWGWWKDDRSYAYLSSYVLYALMSAQHADVEISQRMIDRGMNWLKRDAVNNMRDALWRVHARHAFVAHTLSMKGIKASYKPDQADKRPGDLIERLWQGRDKLSLYGKALLCLSMANLKDKRARTVLKNIMQYKMDNQETQLSWFRTPQAGWWYWWNNDIETNSWVLGAIMKLEPKSPVAPRLVKWLLNNRKNGYYWRSTRDTTMVVSAMSEFVVKSGEGSPNYTLTLDFDNGAIVKKVKINKDNFFTYDGSFIIQGAALTAGKHTVKVTREGEGALYLNSYLNYFTKETDIKASGLELKMDRKYFRLKQVPYVVEVEGSEGQKLKEKRLRYERIPVNTGDKVSIGDVVQVELKVTADNNYTFLAFEDMKPAGFEPAQLKSGGKLQEGFSSYMELRDEKTVFFARSIDQGEHLLRYRLRAEVPGKFHALPAKVFAMYVPELKANSDECVIRVIDEE